MPNESARSGAHVEIIDPTSDSGGPSSILVPSVLRINGVDMGYLTEGGPELKVGEVRIDKFEAGTISDATAITFTLLPRLVEIKHEAGA